MNVSVCIPVYNVAPYIAQCARSLFEQTMKEDIEFIFVDDCSSDDSINILRTVLKEYPNREHQIKIFGQSTNKGVSAARTFAFQKASGKYILCCDADDYVDLDFCEKLYQKANQISADAVVAGYVLEFGGRSVSIPSLEVKRVVREIVRGLRYSSLCTKLIRSDILKDVDATSPKGIAMGEDLMLTSKSLDRCEKIGSVSDSWYHYRQVGTSKIHRYSRKDIDQFMNVVKHLEKNLHLDGKDFDNLKLQYVCMGFKARLLTWSEILGVRRQLHGHTKLSCYYESFGWKRAVLLLFILRMPVIAHALYRIMKCCHS